MFNRHMQVKFVKTPKPSQSAPTYPDPAPEVLSLPKRALVEHVVVGCVAVYAAKVAIDTVSKIAIIATEAHFKN